jgi:hypothetical protein
VDGGAAAHVALGTEAYLGYAHGGTEPWVDVSDIAGGSLARSNAERLDLEPVREPAALAARVQAAAAELLAATEGRSGDEAVTWNGLTVTLSAMLGRGLGEYRLHGRDVAKALGRPWPIPQDDARSQWVPALTGKLLAWGRKPWLGLRLTGYLVTP